jgi:hypothetical protein
VEKLWFKKKKKQIFTSITTVMSNREIKSYLSIVLEDSLHVCIQAVLPTQSNDQPLESCLPQEAKFHLHENRISVQKLKSLNIVMIAVLSILS